MDEISEEFTVKSRALAWNAARLPWSGASDAESNKLQTTGPLVVFRCLRRVDCIQEALTFA
jgi:hypothetical protein